MEASDDRATEMHQANDNDVRLYKQTRYHSRVLLHKSSGLCYCRSFSIGLLYTGYFLGMSEELVSRKESYFVLCDALLCQQAEHVMQTKCCKLEVCRGICPHLPQITTTASPPPRTCSAKRVHHVRIAAALDTVTNAGSITGCHPTIADLKDPSIPIGFLDLTRDTQQHRTIRHNCPTCIPSQDRNLTSRYPRHGRVQHNSVVGL